MLLFGDMGGEYVQWGLLLLSPVLAFFTARGVYNAIGIARAKERSREQDVRYDAEYRNWWSSVIAHNGFGRVYCPLPLDPDESCYAYFHSVSVFLPNVVMSGHEMSNEAFCMPDEMSAAFDAMQDGTRFDVGCGIPVGHGWSVLDWFPNVSFQGQCCLCVTDKSLYVKGGVTNLCICLDDILSVAASCSSVLIESRSNHLPLIVGSVNGQIVRDVLHLLVTKTHRFS